MAPYVFSDVGERCVSCLEYGPRGWRVGGVVEGLGMDGRGVGRSAWVLAVSVREGLGCLEDLLELGDMLNTSTSIFDCTTSMGMIQLDGLLIQHERGSDTWYRAP
jgi:hypothetical protein